MKIRGVGRVKLIAARLRNRIRPGGLILLYHRVAAVPSDPQRLCVAPKHFEEHLQVLRRLAAPISLRRLAASANNRSLPPYSVAITFDDGAADNLHQARPLLDRYDCPATVFVATGYIGNGEGFWWDQLEAIFLQPGLLPETLRATVNGKSFEEALGPAAQYTESDFERHKGWSVLNPEVPSERQRIYLSLHSLLRPLQPADRSQVISNLQKWAHADRIEPHTNQVLSAEEIRQLADGGLVEMGAHTITHPVLSSIPEAVQKDEILNSKLQLEEILGQPVASFAYPYGERADYTNQTVKIVKEAGFSLACSNFKGVVQPGVDLFQLPRFVVGDWSGDEFQRRLKEWFRG